MTLFADDAYQKSLAEINLLPYDGEVYYFGTILKEDLATYYYNHLLEKISWKNDEAVIYGKHIVTARKVAWIGDAHYNYRYSGTTKQAEPWIPELRELKTMAEERAGTKFNSCLLNLYHSGAEGMAWHSDDEAMLGKNTTIASLSFGATRKFAFRHKLTKQNVAIMLEPGSLLIMKGETQSNWQHCLLKSTRVHAARVNLTFRTIMFPAVK